MPKTAKGWMMAALTTAIIVAAIFRVPKARQIVTGQ